MKKSKKAGLILTVGAALFLAAGAPALNGSRENMYKQKTTVLTAQTLGNFHIEGTFDGQGGTSHDTGEAGHGEDHNGDKHVDDTRAQKSYDGDGKQDVRETEKHVGSTHNKTFNDAAVITGQKSEDGSEGCTHNYGGEGNA